MRLCNNEIQVKFDFGYIPLIISLHNNSFSAHALWAGHSNPAQINWYMPYSKFIHIIIANMIVQIKKGFYNDYKDSASVFKFSQS